jgi:hypothetical protein
METDQTNDFLASMSRRVAVWGATFAGLLGLLVAINAALSDEYVGAGVCLVASALSFAVVGNAFARK